MCYDKHIGFFFMGEDFSSSRIKTKCCIIREIELKKHSEIFFKIFSILHNYLMNLWTVSLSLKKPICCLKCFSCITKKPPKPGGIRERRGWLLTLPSTLTLPLSSVAPKGINRALITILSRWGLTGDMGALTRQNYFCWTLLAHIWFADECGAGAWKPVFTWIILLSICNTDL